MWNGAEGVNWERGRGRRCGPRERKEQPMTETGGERELALKMECGGVIRDVQAWWVRSGGCSGHLNCCGRACEGACASVDMFERFI